MFLRNQGSKDLLWPYKVGIELLYADGERHAVPKRLRDVLTWWTNQGILHDRVRVHKSSRGLQNYGVRLTMFVICPGTFSKHKEQLVGLPTIKRIAAMFQS